MHKDQAVEKRCQTKASIRSDQERHPIRIGRNLQKPGEKIVCVNRGKGQQ